MYVSAARSASHSRFGGARSHASDRYSDVIDAELSSEQDRVSPIDASQPKDPRAERRSLEQRANGNALRLGIAAQMINSHQMHSVAHGAKVLPLPPVARMASRYASTANGADLSMHMGFARTV